MCSGWGSAQHWPPSSCSANRAAAAAVMPSSVGSDSSHSLSLSGLIHLTFLSGPAAQLCQGDSNIDSNLTEDVSLALDLA